MPPVTRRASTARPSPSPSPSAYAGATSSSTLPTLSTVPLAPRRTLRDGTAASNASRGSSASSSRSSSRASSRSRAIAAASSRPSAGGSMGRQGLTGMASSSRYPAPGSRSAATQGRKRSAPREVSTDSSRLSSPERDDPDDEEYVPPVLTISPAGGLAIRGRASAARGRAPAARHVVPHVNTSAALARRDGQTSLSPQQPDQPHRDSRTQPTYDSARDPRLNRNQRAVPITSTSGTGRSRAANDRVTGRSLLDLLDESPPPVAGLSGRNRTAPPEPSDPPPPLPLSRSAASSSTTSSDSGSSASSSPLALAQTGSSSTSSIVEIDSNPDTRRYTRAEKGKGRAEVMSPGDSPVMLTKGLIGKRKAEDEVAGLRKRSSAAESAVDRELEREEEDDGEGLDQYSCPVCFSSPSRPVSTLCGHVLCADCLHASLLAAIGRQPNPLPSTHTGPGPAPRPRFVSIAPTNTAGNGHRPRPLTPAAIRTKSKAHPDTCPRPESIDSQPVEWTHATLLAQVLQERQKRQEIVERAAEKQFEEAGMERENWEAAKAGMGLPTSSGGTGGMGATPMARAAAPGEDEFQLVVEMLKGLWKVPGGHVIEGECPVCRHAIPGGMGPLGTGIGSVTPVSAWLEYR